MLKKILLGLVVLIAGIVVYAEMFTPGDMRIVRGIKINAPAAAVFPFVNDPRKMNSWNPWMKMDPNVIVSYSGPESGEGAVSTWDGNSEVGAGKATITRSVPGFLVHMELEYLRPMQGSSAVDFSLKQEGDVTSVDWRMLGKKNLLSKVACLFLNMEKIMGDQFEKGLTDLKASVESPVK